MKYTVVMRIPTEVVVEVEADNEEAVEQLVRDGEYTCDDFNDQVLENLEEAEAELTIE